MLKKYKNEIGLSFLLIALFYITVRVYKSFNQFAFPGLEERILIILIPVGVLAVLLWFPYRWFWNVLRGLGKILKRVWVSVDDLFSRALKSVEKRRKVQSRIREVHLKNVAKRIDGRKKRFPWLGKLAERVSVVGRKIVKVFVLLIIKSFDLIKLVFRLMFKIIVIMLRFVFSVSKKLLVKAKRETIPVIQAYFKAEATTEDWSKSRSRYLVLLAVYALLFIDGFLCEKRVFSIEWAFVGFVISAVVFAIAKIDSRFLIFPAILLLGYCPFLLIGKLDKFAENIAIYAYYFLVVGVVLQFVEYIRKIENRVDFGRTAAAMFRGKFFAVPNITILLIAGVVWVLNMINPLRFDNFMKFTALYFLVAVSVLNIISFIYVDNEKSG